MVKPEVFIKSVRESFIGAEQVYMNGSCVMFFMILQTIYPNAKPYWSVDNRHMITRIGKKYYDITGEVKKDGDYKLDNDTWGSVACAVAFPQRVQRRKRFANGINLSKLR